MPKNKVLIDSRKKANLTIAEAAHQIGISYGMLAMLESGSRKGGDATKTKIAKFYGRTVAEIFFNDDNQDLPIQLEDFIICKKDGKDALLKIFIDEYNSIDNGNPTYGVIDILASESTFEGVYTSIERLLEAINDIYDKIEIVKSAELFIGRKNLNSRFDGYTRISGG